MAQSRRTSKKKRKSRSKSKPEKQVLVGMAVAPYRIQPAIEIIERFASDPLVDKVFVTLNAGQSWKRTGLKVFSGDKRVDLGNAILSGDANKFRLMGYDMHPGTKVLFVDDDIVYPEGYVERVCESVDKYAGCVVSFHGKILKPLPLLSYYRGGSRLVFHYRRKLDFDTPVSLIGTGVMGSTAGTLIPDGNGSRVSPAKFRPANMADIHMTRFCVKNGIPRICLARDEDWLTDHPAIDQNRSIYRKRFQRDGVQTSLLNSLDAIPVLDENGQEIEVG